MPTMVNGKPFVCPHCKEEATIVEYETVTQKREYLQAGKEIDTITTETFYDDDGSSVERECSECKHRLTDDELPNLN